MAHSPEIFASSIVAVGNFNPAIFSADWLERNNLIGSEDANTAREGEQRKALLVTHQVTTFETKWFALQVLENQFSLSSKDALSPAFKDLAIGIMQLVPHTPITAVGLNFFGHYKLSSDDEYHRVGDVLVPKDIWNSLYPDQRAGLSNLTLRIQPGSRTEPLKTKDEKRISVQPSTKLKGVFLSYNDHHEPSPDEMSVKPAEVIARIIDEQWDTSWKDAIRVFDEILSATLKK